MLINSLKYLRICIVLFFILFIHPNIYSSVDSTKKTNRAFWGWNVSGILMQSDFSELRQSPYFLNKPINTFGGISASIFLGNPDKFFIAIPFGLIIPKQGAGTYSGYNLQLGFSGSYIGVNIGCQVYRNNRSKIFKSIYILTGVNQTNYFFTSRASGSGIVNVDTIFYYEYSKARVLNFNPEFMFELFNLVKSHDDFPSYPLTLRLGYNFQLSNPKWTILESNSLIPPRNNAMNGFYFSLGVNIWLKQNENRRKK